MYACRCIDDRSNCFIVQPLTDQQHKYEILKSDFWGEEGKRKPLPWPPAPWQVRPTETRPHGSLVEELVQPATRRCPWPCSLLPGWMGGLTCFCTPTCLAHLLAHLNWQFCPDSRFVTLVSTSLSTHYLVVRHVAKQQATRGCGRGTVHGYTILINKENIQRH